ncbi:glutathione S-transferase [Erwinia persicina]|jgi:glutathione S-transferase|uniref:Glutathione transferase GstA n=1 Tax=Erwinia plantamica TaxID=3237104 RepID=A0ABW7CNM9_9GAMM|nr:MULTISPECIES: glutathione transferase GstA [Erwinia]MCP1438639.1 glutathione S-transferase [Erwinia persicina]MDN8542266.1 glutathione transferase GstA [Erwinia sp. BC051422]
MKLYYSPGACSLAPHIVLHETGLAHELEAVDLKTKTTRSGKDFRAINSKGYVPALALDNGRVMTEGAVISQYLADLNPESGLLPAQGEARYAVLEWMSFISAELHKTLAALFNPAVKGEWKDAVVAQLTRRLNWLENEIDGKTTLTGDRFTIADAYLFTVLGWSKVVGFSLDDWPAVQRYLANVAERPAVQAALKAEGLI